VKTRFRFTVMAVTSLLAALCGSIGAARLQASDTNAEPGPLSLSDATDLQRDEERHEPAEEQPFLPSTGLTLDEVPTSQSAEASPDGAPASDSETLAKKLNNPVADLISIPFQSNFNFGGGFDVPSLPGPRPLKWLLGGTGRRGPRGWLRDNSRHLVDFGRPSGVGRVARKLMHLNASQPNRDYAFKYLLNFQPVIPFSLTKDWNLISRTIIPVVAQHDVIGTSSQGGMGDITQSLFLSPKSTEPFIWGAGPVFLLPTATDHNVLGAYRWGMGPTGVILKQDGPWTVGALANHIWSFARDDGRKEVNATYLQPFLAYTFKTATTLTLNTEATYDWIDDQWNVPLFGGVSQIVKVGKLPVSLQLGGQYWVEGPDSAPDWSMRFAFTFLLPK
jgi:hypothetical protein